MENKGKTANSVTVCLWMCNEYIKKLVGLWDQYFADKFDVCLGCDVNSL